MAPTHHPTPLLHGAGMRLVGRRGENVDVVDRNLRISWAQQPTDPPLLIILALKGRVSSRLKPEGIQDNSGQAQMLPAQPALLLLAQRTIPINCLTKLHSVLKGQLGRSLLEASDPPASPCQAGLAGRPLSAFIPVTLTLASEISSANHCETSFDLFLHP